jgi:hypothetical protein
MGVRWLRARSARRGVLVNQGGLPTQGMTRGRGVLLFYRGGLPTHLCSIRKRRRSFLAVWKGPGIQRTGFDDP